MNAIHLCVFVHRSLLPYVKSNSMESFLINLDIESSEVATGIGNLLGNKGAVAVSFRIGNRSFLFVNCHLACNLEYQSLNFQLVQIKLAREIRTLRE